MMNTTVPADERIDEGRGSGDSAGRVMERVWKIGITTVLFVLLFREELVRLLGRWSTAKESHGLLIPAFSLYFVYQARDQLRAVVSKPAYTGLLLMGLSIFGYLYSSFKGFYYPRQMMMLTLLGGLVLLLGGWKVAKIVWLPVAFLIFAMPLPARLYSEITTPMRIWASNVAAVILDMLPNVTCQASNVVIHGSHAGEPINLNVADACSGMRLLLAFMALGVAMAYLEYRPLLHRMVLVASTIPIAIFCNMVRVVVTGLIYIYAGPEYATGLLHTLLGMVMLVVAFGLYGLLAWIMNNLFMDEEKDAGRLLVVGGAEESG